MLTSGTGIVDTTADRMVVVMHPSAGLRWPALKSDPEDQEVLATAGLDLGIERSFGNKPLKAIE